MSFALAAGHARQGGHEVREVLDPVLDEGDLSHGGRGVSRVSHTATEVRTLHFSGALLQHLATPRQVK
jgi:hypothetical protein